MQEGTSFLSEQRLFLIRHGTTTLLAARALGIADQIKNPRDDPLAPEGQEQARALVNQLEHEPIEAIFVSPLSRAIETAMLAFSSRPHLPMYLDPRLREFNYYQSSQEPMFCRHAGRTRRELQAAFAGRRPHVVWDQVGVDEDQEWWEPHGDVLPVGGRVGQQGEVPTCHDRLQDFLWWLMREEGMRSFKTVAIVAHENVFRMMTGMVGFEPCTPVEARAYYKDNGLVSVVPLSLLEAPPTRAFIALGCSDPSIQEKRLYHALQLCTKTIDNEGQEHSPILIFTGSPAECIKALFYINGTVKSSLSRAVLSRIILDPFSTDTKDNIRCSLCHLMSLHSLCAPAQGVVIHLVTSDWHMPRSLLMYWDQVLALHHHHKAVVVSDIVPCSAPTSAGEAQGYTDQHLKEAWLLGRHLNRHDKWKLWQDTVQDVVRDDMVVMCDNMRRWSRRHLASAIATVTQQEKDDLLGLLERGDEERRAVFDLLEGALQEDKPLAALPLDSKGRYALHVVACRAGAQGIWHDLVMFWGADPEIIQS